MAGKTYAFELEGTLCTCADIPDPYPKRIAHVQKLHEEGHKIFISTERPFSEQLEITMLLAKWKVPYDRLTMATPAADVYIGSKAKPSIHYFAHVDYEAPPEVLDSLGI
jgi:hypothetical protein